MDDPSHIPLTQSNPSTPVPPPYLKRAALFFFILLPFIGFYCGVQYQGQQETRNISPSISTQSNIPTNHPIIPTYGKEYLNEFGYKLQLPTSWHILNELNNSLRLSTATSTEYPSGELPLNHAEIQVSISHTNAIPEEFSLDTLAARSFLHELTGRKQLSKENISVGSLPGVVFAYEISASKSQAIKVGKIAYLPHPNNPFPIPESPDLQRFRYLFVVLTFYKDDPRQQEYSKQFDQIVQSLSFTNAIAIPQNYYRRQYDPYINFVETQPYPQKLRSTPDDLLQKMRCTPYYQRTLSGDRRNTYAVFDSVTGERREMTDPTLLNLVTTIERDNLNGEQLYSFRFCQTTTGQQLVNFTPVQHSREGSHHFAYVENGRLKQPIAILDKASAGLICQNPLQLTTKNLLYYECSYGDGSASLNSIIEIDMVAGISRTIFSCSVGYPESEPVSISCRESL